MQAIVQDVYGEADVLELRDIPVPTVGENDVLVRVVAAGVDRGVWHVMAGKPHLARAFLGRAAPKEPVRGRDVAGTVEAVGTAVTRFRIGDEVFGTSDGSFAEFAAIAEKRLVTKPAGLSFVDAAALPTSGCAALLAVRDLGHIGAGDRVLVLGASGGVGSFAVQLARLAGGIVTGTSAAFKRDLVLSLGAVAALDYASDSIGAGWDVIIDAGSDISVRSLRSALSPKGRLVIVGAEGGGSFLGGVARQLRAAALNPWVSQKLLSLVSTEKTESLEHLGALAASGELKVALDRTFTLAEAPAAVQYLVDGRVRGKVVVAVADGARRDPSRIIAD
jgi:NADPH:quinone reductase-like Zn-dependent oxidoreductase